LHCCHQLLQLLLVMWLLLLLMMAWHCCRECPQVGAHLQEVAPAGLHSVFERLRAILHEGAIDKRCQYMIEGLFAVRKVSGWPEQPGSMKVSCSAIRCMRNSLSGLEAGESAEHGHAVWT